MGIWLSVLFSIPIALAVNLATPFAQRSLSRISGSYKSRISVRDEQTRKRAEYFAKNHAVYVSWVAREDGRQTRMTVVVIAGLIMSAVTLLGRVDQIGDTNLSRGKLLFLIVSVAFMAISLVTTVLLANLTRNCRQISLVADKLIEGED